jgi:hypothetical protein
MRLHHLVLLASLGGLTNGIRAAAADPDPLDRRPTTTASRTSSGSTSSDPRAKSSVSSKGPLPDPALLDGSNQPPEKKSEYGMLGEFELPGSEEKSDRVGGSSQQQSSSGGGSKGEKSSQQGGGGGQQQSSEGSGGSSQASSESGAGGGPAGGTDNKQKGSGGSSMAQKNDPNAKAEGVQSSGLSSPEGGVAAAQGDAMPSKPGEQKIGDATMQIKTLPPGQAASVVGLTQPVGKDVPQAYDAKTPGGGKQSGGSGNKGVEKGRTMPAGL